MGVSFVQTGERRRKQKLGSSKQSRNSWVPFFRGCHKLGAVFFLGVLAAMFLVAICTKNFCHSCSRNEKKKNGNQFVPRVSSWLG